jgi:hypothetical protein
MKKHSIFATLWLVCSMANAQFSTHNTNTISAEINTAGDVNIVLKNEQGKVQKKAILVNNNGTYSLAGTPNVIIPGQSADIKLADLDGNGNGNSNGELGRGIAMNDGTGVFTRSTLDVTAATISCGFADFDNNGLLDYYVFGNGIDNGGTIFFQNNDATFTKDQSSFAAMNLLDADVTTIDFNNDGHVDLFISGWDDIAKQRYSAIYINDGSGKFTATAQPNLIQKGYGSSVWGDVDGDGWLDLLLNGDGGANGETSSDMYRLYKNNKGVLEVKATFNDYRQLSVGDGARMVDWDNDGKLDIILTGWSNTKARQATMLFTCSDATNFIYVENALSNTDFPGVSESSIETADLNNDGRIDLLITGFNGNQTTQIGKYNRNICGFYLNQSADINAKPSTITNLTSVVATNGNHTTVTLSWNPAFDDKTALTALTYNLSLKNKTTGKFLYNPMAIMSGTTNGWRRIAALGNVFTNRKWVLNDLPEGIYEWSVQAIDANFTGGAFAIAKSFTVSTTGVKEVISGVNIGTLDKQLIIENKTTSKLDVTIYSVSGPIIKEIRVVEKASIALNHGIYLVKIRDGSKEMIRKVVI